MSFSDTPEVVLDELGRQLRGYPSVVAADRIDAETAPSNRPELDVVVKATDRRTLPNAVALAVCHSSLGIADCTDANAIGHKRVLIR